MRGSPWLLVVAELAIALVLCSAGALLGVSLARLFAVDPGFDPRGALAVRVSAYAARYPAAPDVQRFFATVAQNLESMPDVLAAAAGSSLPLSGQTSGTGVIAEGQPASPVRASQLDGSSSRLNTSRPLACGCGPDGISRLGR